MVNEAWRMFWFAKVQKNYITIKQLITLRFEISVGRNNKSEHQGFCPAVRLQKNNNIGYAKIN